jgi:hypothetical protein
MTCTEAEVEAAWGAHGKQYDYAVAKPQVSEVSRELAI